MMSMFHKDELTIMVMTGKAEWEGDGLRFSEPRYFQAAGNWIEALTDGVVVGRGCSFHVSVPAGSLVEFRHMKSPRESFSAEEIEAARKTTSVRVTKQEQYDEGSFVFDGTLDDVIASLQTIRNMIPEEYRASAECEITSKGGYEDSHYASIEVTYGRPETDAEVTDRLRSELLRKEVKERQERETFKMLQKKYGTD